MFVIGILIFIVYIAVLWIRDNLLPRNPPIENTQEHLQIMLSLPDEKSRRKYLKSLRKKH